MSEPLQTASIDDCQPTIESDGHARPSDPNSSADLVAQIRVHQRAEWESGRQVTYEEILVRYPQFGDDPECAVDLIYHEFLLREEFGNEPGAEAFVARFPQHAVALRMQIALHRALDGGAASAIESSRNSLGGDVPTSMSAGDPAPVPTVPGYELLDEIGFGGMGVVYRARQTQTNRIVAVKALSAGIHARPAQRARFRAEAELIARLQHPNIVQIHEAGERYGCPYLVLEYVGGGSLHDRLRGAPQPPQSAARFLEVMARALEAAHAAGVVHRDLTPQNILFASGSDASGKQPGLDVGTPKISDFGLAKSFGPGGQSDAGQGTATGDVFGTPNYMSPEQAAGRNNATGPATDIYSLGAILYELLTGRPPFRGVTAIETVQQVVAAEPVPPSRLQRGLSRDLETICLKCLREDPAQRYRSAKSLAEDLQRYLAGEPILARPVGTVSKFARWCRRRPLPASLLLAVFVLTATVVAGAMMAAMRLNQAARDRFMEAKLAEARVHRLDNQLGRADRSLAALAAATRIRPSPELRDETLASLALFDLKFARLAPAGEDEGILDFDHDLKRLACMDSAGAVCVRDLADGELLCRLPADTPYSTVLFSPDAAFLACRHLREKLIDVWSVEVPRPRLVLSEACDSVWGVGAVSFSSDSRQIAVGLPEGQVRLYRLDDGARESEFDIAGRIAHIAFHPHRPQLAVATLANLQVRSVPDGQLLVQLDEAAECEFLSWHPRGELLVTSDKEGSLSIWEPDRLRRQHVMPGHTSGGITTKFNHAGTMLFSTSWDGSLRVWESHWGKPLLATMGSKVAHLRFSEDDRFWAGDSDGARIRIWELPAEPVYRRLTPEAAFDLGHLRTLAISPAGAGRGRLLAVSMERGVAFWDLRTGRAVAHLAIGKTSDLAFDETGNLLTSDVSEIRCWPIEDLPAAPGRLRIGPPRLVARPGTLSQLACSADGQALGLSLLNRGGLVVHREHADLSVVLGPHGDVRSIALTPDGRLAATGSHNGRNVNIWNAHSGALVRELPMGGSRVAFSPEGGKLLTTANGLELWSVNDWRRLWQGAGTHLSAHAFSPDGQFVAVDTETGQIVIYHSDDGRIAAKLNDPYPAPLHALTIAPDGRTLAGISRDLQQLFVWNIDAAGRSLAEMGTAWDLEPRAAIHEVPLEELSLEVRLDDPRKRLEDELAECEKALAAKAGDGWQQQRLGWLLTQLQRDGEARDAYRRALDSGGSPLAPVELAACEIRLGHWREGIVVLERALANSSLAPPHQAGLCNHVAWYLNLAPREYQDPAKALEYAHRALELDPGENRFLNILGLALYRNGETSVAIETLRLGLRTSISPAFDLYTLALCHQSKGAHVRAVEFVSRADYLVNSGAWDFDRQRLAELNLLRNEYQRGLAARED